jgi:hypothetical protein
MNHLATLLTWWSAIGGAGIMMQLLGDSLSQGSEGLVKGLAGPAISDGLNLLDDTAEEVKWLTQGLDQVPTEDIPEQLMENMEGVQPMKPIYEQMRRTSPVVRPMLPRYDELGGG